MDILNVSIGENEINYFSFGNGNKPFVIIPGLSLKSVMLSADAVADAYQQFSTDYRVYVFDRAKNIDSQYTIEKMADDIASGMIELGISKACVFGASQGGMIAQVLAIKYPQLVSKLALGSSASRMNSTAESVISHWIQLAESKDIVALNHDIFTHLYSVEFLSGFSDDVLHAIESDGTEEEMTRFSFLANACIGFDVYNHLDSIKCPVLVLGAKNDMVLTGNASVEIADKINCDLHMYDAGHAVYDEAPDYKDRLIQFFS